MTLNLKLQIFDEASGALEASQFLVRGACLVALSPPSGVPLSLGRTLP